MKTSSQLIYFGLFITLLGFGDNSGKLIPSWITFLIGGLALFYGIYLYYKAENKLFSLNNDWKFDWRALSSKVYIVIGILILRMDRFIDYINENFILDILHSVVGFALMLYGLNLFFKEKREKKGSGNIE
ncbi:hypothetical protein [Maribacter aquivivus]|uniref:hypothetical protein n=1 Tax=Maribacter aquivivus TaxID=228958 RepID=UPI002492E269|nr:hypothetical protein [Maribacter aquivivus]|tara:strand:- start:1021 stop:1410 length:390 start_codon:yes stop_codon:yes gene_type:complete